VNAERGGTGLGTCFSAFWLACRRGGAGWRLDVDFIERIFLGVGPRQAQDSGQQTETQAAADQGQVAVPVAVSTFLGKHLHAAPGAIEGDITTNGTSLLSADRPSDILLFDIR
jgi:hypothetical protein